MTSYVVLKKDARIDGGDWQWLQGPTVEALSAEAAVRKAIDGDSGGTFVAIPIRSFQEMTVTVETKRTVKVG